MSLIPRQPLDGGMGARQSASRGNLVVQCWTDYKVANRLVQPDAELPSKFLRQHAQQSSDKREKRRIRSHYIRAGQHIFAAYSEIFFIGRGHPCRRLASLYTSLQKARIWLKLSPPIFFQLFARKRFTLVFLPYI